MAVYITNGQFYARELPGTGNTIRIEKVGSINKATDFKSIKRAEKIIKERPGKLRNYKVKEVNTETKTKKNDGIKPMGYYISKGGLYVKAVKVKTTKTTDVSYQISTVKDFHAATNFESKDAAEKVLKKYKGGSLKGYAILSKFPNEEAEKAKGAEQVKIVEHSSEPQINKEVANAEQSSNDKEPSTALDIPESVTEESKCISFTPEQFNQILETINEIKEEKQATKPIREKVPDAVRDNVMKQAKRRCYICGQWVPYDKRTIDHKFPVTKGGKNNQENLFCCCQMCNLMKNGFEYEDFIHQISEIYKYQAKQLGLSKTEEVMLEDVSERIDNMLNVIEDDVDYPFA